MLFSAYDILVAEEVGIIPGLNAWASTSYFIQKITKNI